MFVIDVNEFKKQEVVLQSRNIQCSPENTSKNLIRYKRNLFSESIDNIRKNRSLE